MIVISIVAMNVNYYNVYSVIRIQLCTWTTNLQSTVQLAYSVLGKWEAVKPGLDWTMDWTVDWTVDWTLDWTAWEKGTMLP